VLNKNEKIKLMRTRASAESLEIGHFSPQLISDQTLGNGQIGYVVTGLKNLEEVRVGDTITHEQVSAPILYLVIKKSNPWSMLVYF
jgi:GTP-binding protein LepA